MPPDITTRQPVLAYYARPATLTTAGRHAAALAALPSEVDALAHLVQGLVAHEYMASAYGFDVPDARRVESHIRPVDRLLDRIFELDAQPLTVARPVERRVIGVCRHFVLLHLAMLRAKGIAARGRCGFGAYFHAGTYEDHWVTEVWDAAEDRWVLVDSQFDDVWVEQLHVQHDVMDVPRDRFLVAGDAWALCRSGEADPATFGIGDLRGLWFVAGDVVRDIAALSGTEMLAWDVWGAMPRQEDRMTDEQLAFFDRLAELSRAPDASFADLRNAYERDDRLRVPPTVFNAMLNRPEPV